MGPFESRRRLASGHTGNGMRGVEINQLNVRYLIEGNGNKILFYSKVQENLFPYLSIYHRWDINIEKRLL